MSHKKTNTTCASVWDAIEDTPEKAREMKLRSSLMMEVADLILRSGWSPSDAAIKLGVDQSKISNLLHGKISLFDSETLRAMLNKTLPPHHQKLI